MPSRRHCNTAMRSTQQPRHRDSRSAASAVRVEITEERRKLNRRCPAISLRKRSQYERSLHSIQFRSEIGGEGGGFPADVLE